MTALRRLARAHPSWLMLALALAMAARVLVPAGWMPIVDAAGTRLALCDGDMAMAAMAAMPGMASAPRGGPAQHHSGAPDHPCAFAAAAAALDTPALAAPALPAPAATITAMAAAGLVAVGRGLAAPPPPATGPPPAV